MDDQQAIQTLTNLQKECNEFNYNPSIISSEKFLSFRHDVEAAINHIFKGDRKKSYLDKFCLITFSSGVLARNPDHSGVFTRGLTRTKALLESMVREINTYGMEVVDINKNPPLQSYISNIEKISNRFHRIARQMRARYSNRATIDIQDEYDVQDLFHALLHIYFDDIRPEEWTPSYAGKSSRTDFLLKEQEIFIEIKKTRKDHNAGKIGEELSIDITHYKEHPNCKHLICFVYDPDGKIANPNGLISDLERQSSDDMTVKVIITPTY